MQLGLGLALNALRNGSVAAPPSAPWTPADEIAGGKYVWEASALFAPALDAGRTRLSDANGGVITLSAKDAVAGSQPAWTADAGDGKPALVFTPTNGSQALVYAGALSIETESFFYLLRPTALVGNWGGAFGMGGSTDPGFHLNAGSGTAFLARLASTSPVPSVGATVPQDFINTWIAGVIEFDPAGGQIRHWINGALYASAAFSPPGAIAVAQLVVGAARPLSLSTPMQWAHSFIVRRVGASARADGTDYLKRVWGSRVTGW